MLAIPRSACPGSAAGSAAVARTPEEAAPSRLRSVSRRGAAGEPGRHRKRCGAGRKLLGCLGDPASCLGTRFVYPAGPCVKAGAPVVPASVHRGRGCMPVRHRFTGCGITTRNRQHHDAFAGAFVIFVA